VRQWEHVLTTLLQARGAALKRYAFLLCGDDTEAEDLLQDALMRAFTRPPRAQEPDEAERYVRQILLNRFLDQHRRNTRWRRLLPFLAQPEAVRDATDAVADRDGIRTALQSLSPRQRACVVLRFYEDLPVAEVAACLGCGEGTVKRHLSDAMARLADLVTIPYKEVGA
jgi:RNA polymerase sigma-70 factor (sigma-E family)